jgi:hypothetical protein
VRFLKKFNVRPNSRVNTNSFKKVPALEINSKGSIKGSFVQSKGSFAQSRLRPTEFANEEEAGSPLIAPVNKVLITHKDQAIDTSAS